MEIKFKFSPEVARLEVLVRNPSSVSDGWTSSFSKPGPSELRETVSDEMIKNRSNFNAEEEQAQRRAAAGRSRHKSHGVIQY